MAGGQNIAVDPRLLADSSSQHFRSSSNTQEAFFSSSSDSFLASAGTRPVREVDQLVAYLRALEEKQDRIITSLQRYEERLGELEQKHGDDGDDESYQQDTHLRKKRMKTKNSSKNSRILTEGNVRDLSEQQQKVRLDLKAHLQKKMKKLVGLKSNEISPGTTANRNSKNSADNGGGAGAGGMEAGEAEYEGLEDQSDEDEDEEDEESDADGAEGDGDDFSFPDFTKDISDDANKPLVSQAAYLVYKQQTNPQTRKLTFEDVTFTSRDVDNLAKEVFRAWKKKYQVAVDHEKETKMLALLKTGQRRQRRRQICLQKKIDRGTAVTEYIRRHGDVAVQDLLLTDWMSELVSDRSDLEGAMKDEYINEKLVKAGYQLEAKGVETWEVVKPGFRSAAVNAVFAELDEIFESRPRKTKSKKNAVKRVFLGRMNNELPARTPYQFMVSNGWKAIHVDGKGRTDEFEVLDEDPIGFGAKFGQLRTPQERTRH